MSLTISPRQSNQKFTALPQIINCDDHCHLYGILRTAGNEDAVVVLVPANTGTRIGPQRLFVQVSDHLLNQGIATFCVDLPNHGDSFSLSRKNYGLGRGDRLISYYEDHLQHVTEHLRSRLNFKEIILLSISFGCIPILRFAYKAGLQKVILLSPNHKIDEVERVNVKNLRSYRQKLFSRETWIKAMRLNINYKKVIDNVLNLSEQRQIQPKSDGQKAQLFAQSSASRAVDVLCIFGGRDPSVDEHMDYWKQQSKGDQYGQMSLKTINGADHSFFGWMWKESVGQTICEWLKK